MVIDINFLDYQVSSYNSSQDLQSTATVSADGTSLSIVGNGWKSINLPFNINPNTVVEFDFRSTAQGEIHGIAFESDRRETANQAFQLYGTQNWGRSNYNNYPTDADGWTTYRIPVGRFLTGNRSQLVFINDHDVSNPTAQSTFANIRIFDRDGSLPLPTVVDDRRATLIKTPLKIKIADLLANDNNPNGGSLSLDSISGARGGTVALDNQGNVVFTPNANFQGEAGFNYTIIDENGGTDTGRVSVSVKTASIGTNLSALGSTSTQQAFIDLFRSSSGWLTQRGPTYDTREQNLLNLDENGWVKSLTGTGTSQQFTSVATRFNQIPGGRYQAGRYVVLYDGEGTLSYQYDARKNVADSTPGRDVIDVTPTNAGILIRISTTDPQNTGDYIRNIRVVPEAQEFTYEEDIFNPVFLEKTQPYDTLRFMNWMETNNSPISEWSDRPTLEDARWTDKGVPVEIMVELANRLDINPWFNMPHMATNDYVTKFATYVRDNLDPGLEVYLEYSNEVWNSQFQARAYVEGLSDTLTWAQSYGQRSTQIANIWDNVFGADKDRITAVLGGQYVFPTGTVEESLKYAGDSIDAIGLNLYFGRYLGTPQNASTVLSWTQDADGGLNKLFDELNNNTNKLPGAQSGSLPEFAPNIVSQWTRISQEYNKPIFAYEGGQSLAPTGYVIDLKPITDLFIAANRDPRIAELYQKQLTQWYQLFGGDNFMHYSDIRASTRANSFGALEYLDQPGSPKYNALVDFINEYSG